MFAQNTVDQRGFPHIGTPDQSDLDTHFGRFKFARFRQGVQECVEHVANPLTMLGRNQIRLAKAKAIEGFHIDVDLSRIHFVGHEQNRFIDLAELHGNIVIRCRAPLARINHKQN